MSTTVSVVVESVVPLSKDQENVVANLIKKKFGTSNFTSKISPHLLGGIRITVGSTQFDASLLGKLTQLRQS